MRSRTQAPFFLLDAGDALFSAPALSSLDLPQERARARAIAESYAIMGYDAVGVGPYDLAAGVDFLLSLPRLPWVSANLVRADGSAVFPPLRVLERKGMRIAVTGLTGEVRLGKGYRLRPWDKALEDAVAAAGRKGCGFIVLLSSMKNRDWLAISRRFPKIRVVIESGPHGANLPPVIHGRLLRCGVQSRGKSIARLDLGGDLSAPWQEDLSRKKERLLRRLDSLNWRLNRLTRSRRKVGREYLESLKLQKEKTEKELAAVNQALADEAARGRFRARFTAIEPGTADDPAVLEAVEKGKREILAIKKRLEKDRKRRQAELKKIFKAGYTGWSACGRCHEKQAASWRNTRHAYAYNTLMSKQAEADLRCLPCHVTGVKSGKETYALFLPGRMRAVGCEACHGPGQRHTADPAGAPMDAAAARKACSRCHVPEHDGDFNLERDLPLLRCRG